MIKLLVLDPAAAEITLSPEEVWVVMPAYNEGSRIGQTLARLTPFYPHVVVVNDGSRDTTRQVAQSIAGVHVVNHPLNCGQGAALQTGIAFALSQGAEAIVTFDADGQHGVEDIDRLLAPLREGKADVALGSRFLGDTVGMPLSRRLVLKAGVLFTRIFSRIRVTDTHNGLRAFRRNAALQIKITLDGMAHASEILDQIRQHGLSFVEVPVTIHYDAATLAKGQSSWNSLRIVWQLLTQKMMK